MLASFLLALAIAPLQAAKPIALEVKINGQGPYQFGFDTGQSIEVIVSPKLVADLKLPEAGKVTATDGTPGRDKELSLAKVAKFELAGRAWANTQALVVELPVKAVVGSVGFPLFKDDLLTVDLRGGKISFGKGKLEANDKDTFKYLPRQGTPFVPITLGGVDALAHLDTGADRGILIPKEMEGEFKFKDTPKLAGRMATLFGYADLYQATVDGDMVLGPLVLKNPKVHISSLLNFINIGRDVLAKAVFTFDQKNLLIKVAPN